MLTPSPGFPDLIARRDLVHLRAALGGAWSTTGESGRLGLAGLLHLIDAAWVSGFDAVLGARPDLLREPLLWQRVAVWPDPGMLEVLLRHAGTGSCAGIARALQGGDVGCTRAGDVLQWLSVRAWGGCYHGDRCLHEALGRTGAFRRAALWWQARGAAWRGTDSGDAAQGGGHSWWSLLLLDGCWTEADGVWPVAHEPQALQVGRWLLWRRRAADAGAAAAWWRWVADGHFGAASDAGWGDRRADLDAADVPAAAWPRLIRDATAVRAVAGWAGTPESADWLRQAWAQDEQGLTIAWRQPDPNGVRPCGIAWASALHDGEAPSDWGPLDAANA